MIRLWDSKEILHTLSNYLPHNLYETWRLARPGAFFLFTSVLCFTFVFLFCLRGFFLVVHGFFFVCVVSIFVFAWFLFCLRDSIFICLFSFLFACFLFCLRGFCLVCSVSLVGHRIHGLSVNKFSYYILNQ